MLHNIKQKVSELFRELIEWREHIHANPELSFKEFNTAKFVSQKLDEMNIPYKSGVAGTGIVALIEGKHPSKKCIALRADLDALPIQEENEISCKSIVEGVMHACGHDVHTSCLLGAAKILNSIKSDFEGTIKLIFQPGEELLPGGASLMISEGVLENPKVDEIYALHVLPSMEVGKVGFREGMYMAACDELYLSVIGKGGHAALPDQYTNPIMIIAELLPKLEAYINSLALGDSPFIFAFGDLQAHGATNVIPEKALAKGTLRTMDEVWRKSLHHKLPLFVKDFLESRNASGCLDISFGYPYLKNDEKITQNAFTAAKKYLGEDKVEKMSIRMTAEDFSNYSQEIPACFFRIGVRNESLGITHGVHHPKFNVDNKALAVGVGMFTSIALRTLSNES